MSRLGNLLHSKAKGGANTAQTQKHRDGNSSGAVPRRRAPVDDYCNRFQAMLERVGGHADYRSSRSAQEPYGTFQKRHIIGEHTKIDGGVYLGVAPHEALVVDDKYGILREVYTELMVRYVKRHGGSARSIAERQMLTEIVDLVKERLRYMPEEKVQQIVHEQALPADKKIALDVYVQRQAGTDRHQVLLAAYLLERLLQKGLLKGKVYLDAHYLMSGKRKEKLVYSSASGYLFIFSPADARAD